MGNLQWAYLHNAVRDWKGVGGSFELIECRFRSANLDGQTVRTGGRLMGVERDSSGVVAELDIWSEADERMLLASGRARVRLPVRRRRRPRAGRWA